MIARWSQSSYAVCPSISFVLEVDYRASLNANNHRPSTHKMSHCVTSNDPLRIQAMNVKTPNAPTGAATALQNVHVLTLVSLKPIG